MIVNAKEEFLEHIDGRKILGAVVYSVSEDEEFTLPVGFTDEDYQKFLTKLDFNYFNGYGKQELEGWIWYPCGGWSEREKVLRGSEWWEYKVAPPLPAYLTGGKVV